MQTDPVGYEDQMNLYAYVGNDPVNFVDPTGMMGALMQADPNGLFVAITGRALALSSKVKIALGFGAQLDVQASGGEFSAGAEVTSGYQFSSDTSQQGQVAEAGAGVKLVTPNVEMEVSAFKMETDASGKSTEEGPKVSGVIKMGNVSTSGDDIIKAGVTAAVVKVEIEVNTEKFKEEFNKGI